MKSFQLHFVGVGPQRTGTTWLYQLLEHHPALCLPKDVKETMFFDQHYEKGISRYIAHFQHRKRGQFCGEICAVYFDLDMVPMRIHEVNPRCKIIITLRNPITRAFSLYGHQLKMGRVNGTFSEAAAQMPRIVESGRYSLYIPRWLDTFGADGVTFILLDDVASSPEIVLKSIYNFLGVEEIAMPNEGYEKIGAMTMPRFPRLAEVATQLKTALRTSNFDRIVEFGKTLGLKKVYTGREDDMPQLTKNDQAYLLETYQADIDFVENLSDRDLSAWRKVM